MKIIDDQIRRESACEMIRALDLWILRKRIEKLKEFFGSHNFDYDYHFYVPYPHGRIIYDT